MLKSNGQSTAELMGIREISSHGFINEKGEEVVMFLIRPANLSLLSPENLEARIYGLVTVLKGVSEIGMLCLNSRESYDDNKRFYKKRLEEETQPVIRKMLQRDLRYMDELQVKMATSREFIIYLRPEEKTDREKENMLDRIKQLLAEQGFQAKLAERDDVKRILAVYFEQNVTTEKFEDHDGERFIFLRGDDEN